MMYITFNDHIEYVRKNILQSFKKHHTFIVWTDLPIEQFDDG